MIRCKTLAENEGWEKEANLPYTEEALLSIGFTGGSEFNSLPKQTSRVMLFYYLHHSRSPKRTCHVCPSRSISLSLCSMLRFLVLGLMGFLANLVRYKMGYFSLVNQNGPFLVCFFCGYDTPAHMFQWTPTFSLTFVYIGVPKRMIYFRNQYYHDILIF